MKKLILLCLLIPFVAYAGFINDFLSFSQMGGTCQEQKPVLTVTPTSYAFGNQSTGMTRTTNIALSNAGNAALTGITFGTFSSAVFAHSSSASAPCGATLAAKATCNRKVSFTPAAVAAYSGTLVIDSDQLAVRTVNVTGTGTSSVASDNFNRADAATLGSNWTTPTGMGVLKVVSNKVQVTTSGTISISYWTGSDLTNDHCSKITIIENGSGQNAVVVRQQTTGNTNYMWDGTNVIYYLNGTPTAIIIGTIPALSTGDTGELCVNGDTVTAYKNESLVGTGTYSALTTGYAGIKSRYAGVYLDNWFGRIAP